MNICDKIYTDLNLQRMGCGLVDKYQTLEHYFGYKSFRNGQEKLIDGIISGNDVLGIMPTGAGKSICYQIPALMLSGITLVISPLISLMKDQVSALVQSGISAAFINSTLTPRQSELALSRASDGIYKIIYVAPERLLTNSFINFAQNADISMVVVDEAHCVSQWGQNFRPSYLKIAEFVESLSRRPITAAFTATATDRVRDDIINLLKLNSPEITTTGFDRSNLYFEVNKPNDKFIALTSYLSMNRGKSGIIYCSTRKLVEEVADRLNESGWNVGKYHAGMPDSERSHVQDLFIRDECPVIVATNAFGMGIDKSNVSFVVHYNMPKNMESYYQEAGRAGRDGEPAECILLYSGQDVNINKFLIEKSFENNTEFDEETAEILQANELELLKQMTFYSTSKYCLRKFMLRYFGEYTEYENCGNCSNCTQPHTDFESRDITLEAQKVLSCIKRMNENQTKWVIIDILRGTQNNRVELCGGNKQSTFGIMKENTSREIEIIIDSLINSKYITENSEGKLSWGINARGVIYSGMRATMKAYKTDDIQQQIADEKKIGKNANPELLGRLKELRRKVAELNGVPAFVIFSDATLRDMAAKMPTNEAQFQTIYGVGRVKTEKFGRKFMDEIEKFLEESGVDNKPKKKGGKSTANKAKNTPSIHLAKDENGNYILPLDVDSDLFTSLQSLRADLSSDFGIQSNTLVTTDALAQISSEKPVTLAELKKMGILPPRTEIICGDEFIRTVRAHLKKQGMDINELCDCEINPDPTLLGVLKALRSKISNCIHTPQNRIISTPTLEKMSEIKPVTRSQLVEKIHLGNSKCLVFGQAFVQKIREYLGETELPDGFDGAPQADRVLFLRLADLRHSYALKENKSDLTIMSDYTLYDLCIKKPQNEENFRTVYGIGEFKSVKYCAEFTKCIIEYLSRPWNNK